MGHLSSFCWYFSPFQGLQWTSTDTLDRWDMHNHLLVLTPLALVRALPWDRHNPLSNHPLLASAWCHSPRMITCHVMVTVIHTPTMVMVFPMVHPLHSPLPPLSLQWVLESHNISPCLITGSTVSTSSCGWCGNPSPLWILSSWKTSLDQVLCLISSQDTHQYMLTTSLVAFTPVSTLIRNFVQFCWATEL